MSHQENDSSKKQISPFKNNQPVQPYGTTGVGTTGGTIWLNRLVISRRVKFALLYTTKITEKTC